MRFLKTWMVLLFTTVSVGAVELQLRDGRALVGREGLLPALGEMAAMADISTQNVPVSIVFLDDDLRRTYFSKRLVVKVSNDPASQPIPEKFVIDQRIKDTGPTIEGVGTYLRIDPFDDFGRRTIQMSTSKGSIDLLQCITELTPEWTKVECSNYIWDMRLATSSLPREQLVPILRKQAIRICKGNEVEAANKIARFFIQGERYEEAAMELNRVIQLANDPETARKELSATLALVRQMSARKLLGELELRRKNGQDALVRARLKDFPSDGVAGETLQQVREMLDEYDATDQRIQACIDQIQKLWKALSDAEIRETLKPVLVEILENVNHNTIARMEPFEDMMDADGMEIHEKLALAVTGWLLGGKNASDKIVLATSAVRVREQIRKYLEADGDLARETLFQQFHSEEAATVKTVTQLLAHMKPPVRVSRKDFLGKEGFFRLQTSSDQQNQPVEYWVQLPPEYDPHRLYPVVLCLGSPHESPEKILEWWAGGFTPKGTRLGQAGRHGYIVIAPRWARDQQREYTFSEREHNAIRNALADACQKFSIDSDRVFLTGHFLGGDAAWDIGLAHPDLWAGVILVSCEAKKYCVRYWQNAKILPMYFVCGELDNHFLGEKTAGNLSRYLTRGYDATIVEYLGRGLEDFHDEIQRMFDWMNRKRRNFYPEKFAVGTMRPWDNRFWWIEVDKLPPKAIVLPDLYPTPGAVLAKVEVERLPRGNSIQINARVGKIRVWLGPQTLDFDRKMNIVVNAKNAITAKTNLKPDLRTLLDDVRRRGDRQNPFWAMIEVNTGRVK
ncbi:MAG: peptidase [Planctomycetia bacterium]|nr:peptidase [Planctomycetia bacterium]